MRPRELIFRGERQGPAQKSVDEGRRENIVSSAPHLIHPTMRLVGSGSEKCEGGNLGGTAVLASAP